MIYLGADHRGFELKEKIKMAMEAEGLELQDVGAFGYEKTDDYVDFAKAAAEKVVENPKKNKAILICGSGHGMDMMANKYKGVRSALAFNTEVAIQSREHEDANVLVLASDWLEDEEAIEILKVWLRTEFTGEERHVRRLKKIEEIEKQNFK
ncbi:MAG: RpiB/LacA/LacB family sugar-phosphate isomerase [bacterium]|nr:RpiB/LacA/LacB family sugar-phosphate isomerase [bacterium]